MAEVTKEQVVEFISNMSVLELSEMVKELEEKFGVSAAAAAVAAAPAAGGASRKEFRQKKLKRSKRSLKKPELPQKSNKFVSRCGILVRGCRIDHGLRTDLAYSFPLFILVDSDYG